MNQSHFGPSPSYGQSQQSPYEFYIRQHPEKARVVVKGKEKDRKPIDPPPILQLVHRTDPTFLHNPYLFCKCWLWHESEHRPASATDASGAPLEPGELLMGQTVSSLHRLKDLDNTERGFFVFGDLSIATQGKFRIRFCLWEYNLQYSTATFLGETITRAPFEVSSAKDWDGIRESTVLSRTIADQGIKLRLRKESRHPRGRAIGPSSSNAPSAASTPIRPNPVPAGGSYGSSGADSSSGGGSHSATATPYSASLYSTTGAGAAYHQPYGAQGMNAGYGGYYQSPTAAAYPGGSYNYAYNASYGMNPPPNPSHGGGNRTPGGSSGSYVPSSPYSSAPVASGYPASYGQGGYAAGGAAPSYSGQGEYAQRGQPQPQQGGQQQQSQQQQPYGTPLPSLSASTSMSNPGSTPHLAPISFGEHGQPQAGSASGQEYRYGDNYSQGGQ